MTLLQISDQKLICNWLGKTDQKLTCPAVESETDVKFSVVINSQVITVSHYCHCLYAWYCTPVTSEWQFLSGFCVYERSFTEMTVMDIWIKMCLTLS